MGGAGANRRARLADRRSTARSAYSEILPDEKGATCTGFIARAADYFAAHGMLAIERVMTDNHYRRSADVAAVIATLGAKHKFIKPHRPWRNGKVERFNRPLQAEWACRHVFTSTAEPAAALPLGSKATTLADATARSAASHRSAARNQPDGRVHL
jgi:transposase InsO family protein